MAVIVRVKKPTLTVDPTDQSCFERVALIMCVCVGLFAVAVVASMLQSMHDLLRIARIIFAA